MGSMLRILILYMERMESKYNRQINITLEKQIYNIRGLTGLFC